MSDNDADRRDVMLLLEHALADEGDLFNDLFNEIKRDERLEDVCLTALAVAQFILNRIPDPKVRQEVLRQWRVR